MLNHSRDARSLTDACRVPLAIQGEGCVEHVHCHPNESAHRPGNEIITRSEQNRSVADQGEAVSSELARNSECLRGTLARFRT